MSVESRTVNLISQDGESFLVPVHLARISELVKTMIDDDSDDAEIQEIPLPNVKSSILSKIIEFAQYNAVSPMNELPKPLKSPNLKDFVQEWYVDFIAVKQPVLFELIRAANYMDIKPLLELGCASIASLIKGKKEDEVRELFQNEDEVTHEGEAHVCEEN